MSTQNGRKRGNSTVGERFYSLRRESTLTMRGFGDSLGVSSGYISDIEKGEKTNVSRTLTLLASYKYKVNYKWLLTGEGERAYSENIQKTNGDHTEKYTSGEDIRMLFQVIQELAILKSRIEKLESQLSGKQKKNQPPS